MWDRNETFNYFATDELIGYEMYTEAGIEPRMSETSKII